MRSNIFARFGARAQFVTVMGLLFASAGCGEQPSNKFEAGTSQRPRAAKGSQIIVSKEQGIEFSVLGTHYVPVDFINSRSKIELDPAKRKAWVKSSVEFQALGTGYPYLDLLPKNYNQKLAHLGEASRAVEWVSVSDPSGLESFKALSVSVEKGEFYRLEVEYPLPFVRWETGGGINFVLAMGDLSPRGYLEQYFPANFLHDAFSMQVEIVVIGSPKSLHLFTNGVLTQGARLEPPRSKQNWVIEFPEYFNSTCPFLHLTSREVAVRDEPYVSSQADGTTRVIPLTVYNESMDQPLLEESLKLLKDKMKEYETAFGPYAHAAFLGHIQGRDGGGMEYAGATESSLGALSHELLHSWFARGAIAGNDGGWVDEAVVSWVDGGMPSVDELVAREPIQFAGLTPLYRMTRGEAYSDGKMFISELNRITGGKIVQGLSKFYLEYFRKPFSTEQFLNSIKGAFPQHASEITERATEYVYGASCDVLNLPVIGAADRVQVFGSDPALIDVLSNDQSCQAQGIEIEQWDVRSKLGATIEKTELFPGYPILKYVAQGGLAGLDEFYYRLSGGSPVRVLVSRAEFIDPVPGSGQEIPGLKVAYYELGKTTRLPDFTQLTPFLTGVLGSVDWSEEGGKIGNSGRLTQVGAVIEGFLKVEQDAVYDLILQSDDGSALWIGGKKLIAHDGLHGMNDRTVKVGLKKGLHPLKIDYFQNHGGYGLRLQGAPVGQKMHVLSQGELLHFR